MALAYHAIGDYSHASDGFCSKRMETQGGDWGYTNEGRALEYVQNAVIAQLRRDGYTVGCPEACKDVAPLPSASTERPS